MDWSNSSVAHALAAALQSVPLGKPAMLRAQPNSDASTVLHASYRIATSHGAFCCARSIGAKERAAAAPAAGRQRERLWRLTTGPTSHGERRQQSRLLCRS